MDEGPQDPRSAPAPERPPAQEPPGEEPPPLGQRLFDRPFLLLAAGLLVMLFFFTFWGLWEIMNLPEAPLP